MKTLVRLIPVVVIPVLLAGCSDIPSSPGPPGKGDWQSANARAKEKAEEDR